MTNKINPKQIDISETPEATSLNLNDLILVEQGGINKHITAENAGLVSYLSPAFTAFAITGISIVEVGYKITGTQTFTWAISNVGNVQANSIYIKDVTSNITLIPAHSVTSPETYDFSLYSGGGLQYNIQTSNQFQIQGTNTNLQTFLRNYLVNWNPRYYVGANASPSLSEAQIKALATQGLATAFPPSVPFAGGTTYFWYWIPDDISKGAAWIQPTIFKDAATQLQVDMEPPVTQSVTNSNGVNIIYKGYRSTYQLINGATILVS